MEGYFDLHTHILPNVDDGSESLEMTKKMLQIAYDQGVRCMMATPHFTAGNQKYNEETLLSAFHKTQKIAETIGDGMKLYLGNELFYDSGTITALEEKKASTLAETDYVLVEFLPDTSYKKIYAAMKELIQNGYRPIIAHMERYHELTEQTERIDELVETGCYLQMNVRSLVGGLFDTKAKQCRDLLKEGKIHFLGSDCHNVKYRPPKMEEVISFLKKKKIDNEIIETLVIKNPKKMINNEYI